MSVLPEDLPFRSIVFFEGMEHLPDDLVFSLGVIRDWAVRSGFVSDPDFQLLVRNRVAEIVKVVTPEDELGVAIAISNRNGELEYFEYPFLSVRSLIKRGTAIPIVYWKVISTQWGPSGNVTVPGEVKFGFWLTGCTDEFCSMSTAARIIPKFVAEMDKLASECPVKVTPQGSREVTVNGGVLATFFKQGRSFDVVLSNKQAA